MSNDATGNWLPSESLRRWMMWGAVALGVDVLLCAASLAFELSPFPEPNGFSATDVIEGSIVIPQIVVLFGFLALAREVQSFSLWRSSIGVFGCLWLLAPLMYTSEEGWNWWDTVLSLAVLAGAVCVIVLVVRRPAAFSATVSPAGSVVEPQPDSPAASPDEDKQSDEEAGGHTGCSLGAAIATALLLKVVARGLKNVNAQWVEILLVLLAVLLLICLAGFSIWFGVVKIRLRDRLGKISAVCGAADIFSVLFYFAVIAYVSVIVTQMAIDGQEPDFTSPRFLIPIAAMSIYDIVWKGLMAALFLSIRARGSTAWEDELTASGRYIDRR